MERAWYVLQTNRYKEQFAARSLAERGINSYLPRIVQWPRPVVGSAIAPMFPGYLFVNLSENDCARVSWTPGVRGFVSFGSGPVPIDAGAIDFLRGREGPDGVIRCESGIRESCEVRIIRGPFHGLTAIVTQRLPARERVRVLMDLLQRQTTVELPERWVARP